jgi:diazepam-binding inhibitor (GABA receptor modulating acyl-CoA-binding protein)
MTNKELFDQAVADSRLLPTAPSNEVLLKLYGLFKQSEVGDINIETPANVFDFVARAKYEAWLEMKGKSKEAAMQEYVDLVNSLKG